MSFRSFLRSSLITKQCVRGLMLHEYHGVKLLQNAQINVRPFEAAKTADEAFEQAKKIVANDYVVKANVLTGGRGKGKFDSGLQGGVQLVSSPEEVKEVARQMLGYNIFTEQTGEKGLLCEEILIGKQISVDREYYFSITLDRITNGPILVASSKGGVNIEEVAASDPSAIIKVPIDIKAGVTDEIANKIVTSMGFKEESTKKQAVEIVKQLYKLFLDKDCSLIEINPLVMCTDGSVMCIDCKIGLDSNAKYRQSEIFALNDNKREDELEIRAEKAGLNYIRLNGNIGCMVNGAGLAMATMDIIKLYGGEPANFLDVGGSATVDQVAEAFKIITADNSNVNAILVNIFGGIMRCDIIAEGIIKAASELNIKIPIIVRLQGTKVNEAKALIENSKMGVLACDSLVDATKTAVKYGSSLQ